MTFLKIWLFLSILFLWTGVALSGEIKFDDIASFVERKNQKLKSLDSLIESEARKTGSLARSFVPDLALFAGREDFHSDRLGDQSSGFYGLQAKASIFNGMSDYWEEEKRKSNVLLAKANRWLSRNELIFEARKSYLKLAEAKVIKAELNDSLNRLDDVFRKVQKKVKGGVISGSDLTSLRLVQAEFEHEAKDLLGEIAVEIARLKTLLGISDLGIGDIDERVLTVKSEEPLKETSERLPLVEKYKAESQVFASEGKALAGETLPEVQLLASYGRRPFSEREFAEDADREEWAAGVQLVWKVGDAWEHSRQAQAARLQSSAVKNIGEYYSDEIKNHINALAQKMRLLVESAQGLEKEIGLSQNHYSQISAEYLRGVKSTSDLTSTFNQLLELKRHRVRLIYQYNLAQAEMKKLTGEN